MRRNQEGVPSGEPRDTPAPDGSPRPSQRIPRRVAYAVNHDLVRQDPVKNEIGIGKHGDASKAAHADAPSRMRVRRDKLDDDVDATLDVTSTQRRMIIDVSEDIL